MATLDEQRTEREHTRQEKKKHQIEEALAQSPSARNYGDQVRAAGNKQLTKDFRIKLSPIEDLPLSGLQPNPANKYPPLTDEAMQSLVDDIREMSILIPLIARPDGVLVCGHNRLRAAQELKFDRVPVQTILHPSPLPHDLELAIMRSENERRRNGWSREEAQQFILQNFGHRLDEDNRGRPRAGAEKSEHSLISLPEEVQQASRGKISNDMAKRHLAELRKQRKGAAKKPTPTLTPAQKTRARTLVGEIRKLEKEAGKLEQQASKKRDQAKGKRKDLVKIGPLHQFGL